MKKRIERIENSKKRSKDRLNRSLAKNKLKVSDSLATSSGENGDNLRIFLASNLDRVQQHLRLELTKKQQEKEDYERLIQELAVSELEEKESQNEKVSSSVQETVLVGPWILGPKLDLFYRVR